MKVLAVIHGEKVRPGTFGGVLAGRGHELDEWSLAWNIPPPRPLDDYGAALIFGGAMHADQDDRHPWLREENFLIQRLVDLRIPLFGICLGAQLLAKAARSPVYPSSEPEIGWFPVELTPDAAEDPVFGRLPERFHAFQWHYYTYRVPDGAAELARSRVCTQAFRLGEVAWGIQFHAEVTEPQIQEWAAEPGRDVPVPRDELLAETRRRIGGWNRFGRTLCGSFLEVAESVGAPV